MVTRQPQFWVWKLSNKLFNAEVAVKILFRRSLNRIQLSALCVEKFTVWTATFLFIKFWSNVQAAFDFNYFT